MTPDLATLGAAVRAADTYKDAAEALGLPYGTVYRAARRIGARPKLVGTPAQPRAPLPVAPPASAAAPPAAPEPLPPQLSSWIAPPDPLDQPNLVAVRLDRDGRVRAEVSAEGDSGWHSWTIRDITGARVGRIGLRGSLQEARDGADAALRDIGWLPAQPPQPATPRAEEAPPAAARCPTCGSAGAGGPHLVDGQPLRDRSGNVVTAAEYADLERILAALLAIPEERRLKAFARAFDAWLKTNGFRERPTAPPVSGGAL